MQRKSLFWTALAQHLASTMVMCLLVVTLLILGNSTKITLNASGLGEFKGGVKVENSDGSKSTSLEYASGIFRIQDNDNGGRIQLHTNRVNISRLYLWLTAWWEYKQAKISPMGLHLQL